MAEDHSVEGRPLEDSELVALAQRGDVNAYEELVRRYQEIAFRTAYLVVGNSADAEDVAQEAFVKAYYALSRVRPGAPFRPWLLRIVANEACNRRRAAGRRAALVLRAGEHLPTDDAAPSPDVEAIAREQRALLLRALSDLREEDRLAIAYRYFLDLSESEMAEAMGCPRGTVKSRLSRALGRLRSLLGEMSGDLDARRLAGRDAGARKGEVHG